MHCAVHANKLRMETYVRKWVWIYVICTISYTVLGAIQALNTIQIMPDATGIMPICFLLTACDAHLINYNRAFQIVI